MASAPRSFWKGHMRLALVTIPIRLVSAASSEDKLALHQVDRRSKSRVRYQKISAETAKVVPPDDIVQGYEVEPGQYILLDDTTLDALKLSTRHTLELTQFVDACSVDPLYFDRPYYVLPDGEVAEEGYRIIRDALRTSKKYGIGQLTMRGRENLVALKPSGEGLMLETLRYDDEVKDAVSVFSGISDSKLKPQLIEMALDLIAARSAPFDPSQFHNHYAQALRELVQSKLKGGEAEAVSGDGDAPSGGTIIDFMEALRRSTASDANKSGERRRTSKRAASAAPTPALKSKNATPSRKKSSQR